MIVDQIRARLVLTDIADNYQEHAAMPAVLKVAEEIVWSCLCYWDGWTGWRAKVDSHGNQCGIWLAKFETVRCASLLLAMQNVNAAKQAMSGGTTYTRLLFTTIAC